LSNGNDVGQGRPYLGIDFSDQLVGELPPTFFVGATANIPTNHWTHVALTYSFPLNNIALYYNRSLQNSWPGPSPMYNPVVTTPPVYVTLASPIGGHGGSVLKAQPFNGAIDEFYI
jgi:hypothetical protein